MPFLDHLEELRQRLLKCILSVFLLSVGSYFFAKQIMNILLRPYPHDKALIFLKPTEGFLVYIKLSIFVGIILSLPVIFYQLWRFIAPGLYKKERKYIPIIVFFSTFFFLLGAFFCYFIIIPYGLNFLLGFTTEQLKATIQITEYLKFVTLLILVFGIIFELPLLSYFLTKMDLITPEFMRSKRRYGIVLIFIIAAILTPPDVVTQLFLAGPLIILYEISIWVSKAVMLRKLRKAGESNGS
ncbi:MAG: twin-arginine translocase subunit TatC [bacterium]|nr:MAG: twin-arginine translocase subunit TatC [bacterium]